MRGPTAALSKVVDQRSYSRNSGSTSLDTLT